MSSPVFWEGLARFSAVGASACADAVALSTTRSEMVKDATQTSRHMDARYAGNYSARQAFFSKKYVPAASVIPVAVGASVIVRKVIRLKSRWWSKHLVPVDHGAATRPRTEFFFIRGDDRGAARWQSKNQASIRGNTDHPTTHCACAASWPVFGQLLRRTRVC